MNKYFVLFIYLFFSCFQFSFANDIVFMCILLCYFFGELYQLQHWMKLSSTRYAVYLNDLYQIQQFLFVQKKKNKANSFTIQENGSIALNCIISKLLKSFCEYSVHIQLNEPILISFVKLCGVEKSFIRNRVIGSKKKKQRSVDEIFQGKTLNES